MFLNTPHRGSAGKSIGELVSRVAKFTLQEPNDSLVYALKKISDILERQRRSFETVAENDSVVCIYEELPTVIGLVNIVACLRT